MSTLGYELTHRFNDMLSFRQSMRYSHMHGYQDQLFRNTSAMRKIPSKCRATPWSTP